MLYQLFIFQTENIHLLPLYKTLLFEVIKLEGNCKRKFEHKLETLLVGENFIKWIYQNVIEGEILYKPNICSKTCN